MPLKHATETVLVFILGFIIAITGVFVATLPHVPEGGLPWGLLFFLAIVYPLSLTYLFKKNRADYAFRWLHWFPAFILIFWMGAEIAAKLYEPAEKAFSYFKWGWSYILVAAGLTSVAIFCLRVIRRRLPRLLLLITVFVPFSVFAFISEGGREWERMLADVLWESDLWLNLQNGVSGTGSRMEIAFGDKEPRNLSASPDPAEEEWRKRLRMFERRRQRIAQRIGSGEDQEPEVAQTPAPRTGTGREYREAETSPAALPSSGAGFGALGITMFMGYLGVIHSRARKHI